MFKRLTGLITPPVRKSSASHYIPPDQREPDLSTLLKPQIKRLILAPSIETPEAQECLAGIKQIALARGLYLTAFEIRTLLDMMPKADEKGAVYQKQRGYVLAGDFFLSHIYREIESAKQKSQPAGPKIFREYCNEMIECLLRSGNVRRAIEVPMMVIDALLSGAIEYPALAENFLELATQISVSATTLSKQRFDHQQEPTNRSSISSGDLKDPFLALDAGALDYIESLQRRVRELKSRILQYEEEALKAGSTPGPMARLQGLLGIAIAVKYEAFAGLVKEYAALMLLPGQPDKAQLFQRNAAMSYEEQGDCEIDLFFTKLSGARYRRALDLYRKAGDEESAQRVTAKASSAAIRGKH